MRMLAGLRQSRLNAAIEADAKDAPIGALKR